LGGVFGSVYGWERANWFAPSEDYEISAEDSVVPDVIAGHNHADAVDGKVKERYRFGRSNAFEHIGNEIKNVTENVGLLDMSAFAKMEVAGPGARQWLESLFANKIPKKRGRIALCHMLTKFGGVRSEFTVYEWKLGSFYLVSAGAFENHDHDYLHKLLPDDGSVNLRPITQQYGVLVLAGPKARDVLQKLTYTDLSNDNFKWLSGQKINVGTATAHALRVNFVGELGWELHHPIETQNAIYDAVMEAGAEFGIKPFGIRAMSSMSIEKSYRLVPRELSTEYNILESGLNRFVHVDKGEFIGRDAIIQAQKEGLKWNFVTMQVHDVDNYDPRGSEALYDMKGNLIGRATNGAYGWRLGKTLALGMVKPGFSEEGQQLQIKMLGKLYNATIIAESPFDAKNERLRG
jgi:dimethylglycine dehydrogenase